MSFGVAVVSQAVLQLSPQRQCAPKAAPRVSLKSLAVRGAPAHVITHQFRKRKTYNACAYAYADIYRFMTKYFEHVYMYIVRTLMFLRELL